MFATLFALMVAGLIIAVIGWILNTNTPIQQPLPVIGLTIALACGILLGLMK